ncbi:MAG: sigma-70 family RNA polymerase sigma factor [Alphaproteobacteria bacterium]|nr:sigma-70 family RNA polymerase sigma factor [Alphaproteobacteria bacterium]
MIDPVLALRVVRTEWSRIVSAAMRILHDLDLAEDAAQEALLVATEKWPVDGIPANPGAWLTTVTRRRALNILRGRKRRRETALPDGIEIANGDADAPQDTQDDRLTLLLLCCHPTLSHDSRVTLTLRLAGGLSTREIARGLVIPEKTIGQRISRAKSRLRDVANPFSELNPDHLTERSGAVMEVIYLIFNAGYLNDSADAPIKRELLWEAAMLSQQLCEVMPDNPEAWGLASLIQFKTARTGARITANGHLVPLDEQDRSAWDRVAITRGERFRTSAIAAARRGPAIGAYAIQAEIEAHHCRAETFGATDWISVERLYETLAELTGNPVTELGWVVARSYARSPAEGLDLLERLGTESNLANYPHTRATRADLLRRAGQSQAAEAVYAALMQDETSQSQRLFYQRRLSELAGLKRG